MPIKSSVFKSVNQKDQRKEKMKKKIANLNQNLEPQLPFDPTFGAQEIKLDPK